MTNLLLFVVSVAVAQLTASQTQAVARVYAGLQCPLSVCGSVDDAIAACATTRIGNAGVSCTGGFVTALTLPWGKAVAGQIVSDIGQLSELRFVGIYRQAVSGSLPEAFFDLTNLVEINIDHNLLSGTLSRSLGRLTNLEVLHINNNTALVGRLPSQIGALQRLHTLKISDTAVVGPWPAVIANMPCLEMVWTTPQLGNPPLPDTPCPPAVRASFMVPLADRTVVIRPPTTTTTRATTTTTTTTTTTPAPTTVPRTFARITMPAALTLPLVSSTAAVETNATDAPTLAVTADEQFTDTAAAAPSNDSTLPIAIGASIGGVLVLVAVLVLAYTIVQRRRRAAAAAAVNSSPSPSPLPSPSSSVATFSQMPDQQQFESARYQVLRVQNMYYDLPKSNAPSTVYFGGKYQSGNFDADDEFHAYSQGRVQT